MRTNGRLVYRHLAAALVLSVVASLRAGTVDDFEGAPGMKVLSAQERGAVFAVEDGPKDGDAAHGKAGKLTWVDKHAGFQELYYDKDVAVGGAETALDGKVVLKVYTETPEAVWTIAVRLKDQKGEIFHFDMAVAGKLEAKKWNEVVIPTVGGKQQVSWGGGKTGKVEGAVLLTGYAVLLNKDAAAGTMWIDDVTYLAGGEKAADATTLPTTVPTAKTAAKPEAKPFVPPTGKEYRIEEAGLLEPFWKSEMVKGESVLFLQETDGAPADGTLLFTPKKIVRVRSGRENMVYEEGKDYVVKGGRLVRTDGSRIPFLKKVDLYKKAGEKAAIKFKVGDPETWLLYREAWFQDQQVEVDYVRDGGWTGYTPKYAGSELPRVIAKLKAKDDVKIVYTGDSITSGANASGRQPPYMPPYPVLVAKMLERTYGGKVGMENFAVGGTWANGGLDHIDQVIGAKPDLVVIAFGMNDVAGHNAKKYGEDVKKMIEAVRAALPGTEFIVVASSVADPEWNWSPAEEFPKYRDALAALTRPGVVLADATALWTDILKKKRYHDLAGNGINHPNDYGHRLYAELLLGLLVDEGGH